MLCNNVMIDNKRFQTNCKFAFSIYQLYLLVIRVSFCLILINHLNKTFCLSNMITLQEKQEVDVMTTVASNDDIRMYDKSC